MRLIDANALIAEMHNVILEDGDDRRIFYEVIERQQIIDPVRRGKLVVDEFGDTRCSECDGIATDSQAAIFKWCPYCGAKMEEQ